jgi:hypothetical protein
MMAWVIRKLAGSYLRVRVLPAGEWTSIWFFFFFSSRQVLWL